jgi:asparagine synthase (glutamine-hydrolysing)
MRQPVGGAVGPEAAKFASALARELGPSAQLLPARRLAVDADACTLDERPLVTDEHWRDAIGASALARVNGAFALAWLSADGATWLARDAIGHRSLFYTQTGERLVFASRLRALLDVGAAERRIHLRSLAAYLTYAYVPGRETLVERVFELLPGELVRFRSGVLERHQFWDLPAEPPEFEAEAALSSSLRRALEHAVFSMLPRDARVAAALSGGIDSSLVVALAQRAAAEPVRTFSITFGAGYKDELAWSTLVAQHCGTEHTIVELSPEAIVAHLDDTAACLHKPNGDPLTVPNALLFRCMAERASVALNGEGGDPCFGGPKNPPMLLSTLYGHGHEQYGRDPGLGDSAPLAQERAYLRAHLKTYDELRELLLPDVHDSACSPALEHDLQSWFSDPRWTGLVAKLMAINTRFKGGHHILPKVEALSAPFALAARSPLFSKAIVELAFAIPPELKLRGSEEKYLLKRAASDLLPEAILRRPKSGMLVPVEGWFQGPLLAEARVRILDGLAQSGWFQRPYLERLLQGTLGGLRPRRGVKIWLLVALEAHLRTLRLKGP